MVARRIPDPKVAGSIPVIFSLVCRPWSHFLRWGVLQGALRGGL